MRRSPSQRCAWTHCANRTPLYSQGAERFESTFEKIYTAESLTRIPWYAIAGNHDHGGNVTAEIGYTTNPQNRPLHGINPWTKKPLPAKRWTMPNYWHNITQHFEVGGKPVELEVLLFDSCVMAGNSDVINEDGSVTELKLSQLPGPPDPALANEQLEWIEERMKASTADFFWVGGHYPVWAIGNDPPTGVEEQLRPLLNRWEAHYFNG